MPAPVPFNPAIPPEVFRRLPHFPSETIRHHEHEHGEEGNNLMLKRTVRWHLSKVMFTNMTVMMK
jgi:hypothetical protein